MENLAAAFLGASILVTVATLVRWRWTPGLGLLCVLCLPVVGWCWAAWEYERGGITERENALWLFFVSLSLTGGYLFARRAWGRHDPPSRRQLAALLVEPVVVLASGLIWPDWWSGAFASGYGGTRIGWAFVLHSLWCVALILVACGLLLRRVERSHGQLRWLLLGSVGSAAFGVAVQLSTARLEQLAAVLFVLFDSLAFPELRKNPLSDVDESERDAVTGLLNRGALDRLVAAAVDRADSRHEPLSLVYVDIDKFKSFNDSYGHLTGDFVLKTIAERISHTAGPRNRVGRFGGDEFVVVAPDSTAEEASLLAQQIVAVCAVPVVRGELVLHPAVSAGVAAYAGGGPLALMDAADRAMYEIKRAGGNAATR